MAGFEAPFLPRETLEARAEGFLASAGALDGLPIPIEMILERSGVDIVPVPGLQSGYDIDGYLSADLSTISVDEYVYLHRPTRYRFTLAHEAGHRVLHGDLYRSFRFRSLHEWKDFVASITDREWGLLE